MERPLEAELVWHAVGTLDELPVDGGGRTVRVGDRHVALFHHRGEVTAVDDRCPHMGASLGQGVAIDGDVTCPWHAWHFRLRDGCNTDGLEVRVAVHPVRVAPDGRIEVGLPPEARGSGEDPFGGAETSA